DPAVRFVFAPPNRPNCIVGSRASRSSSSVAELSLSCRTVVGDTAFGSKPLLFAGLGPDFGLTYRHWWCRYPRCGATSPLHRGMLHGRQVAVLRDQGLERPSRHESSATPRTS